MAASRRPQPPVQDAMAPWVVEVSSRPTSRPASHDRAATIATVVLSVPLTGPVQRLPQQYVSCALVLCDRAWVIMWCACASVGVYVYVYACVCECVAVCLARSFLLSIYA